MNSEQNIQSEIRCALSKHGLVFRTNAGDYWQGDIVYSKEFKQKVLINIRRVAGLPDGFSDLLVVGDKYTGFVEVKTPTGRIRPEQINFINKMQSLGHKAGIARCVEDAIKIIGGSNNGI